MYLDIFSKGLADEIQPILEPQEELIEDRKVRISARFQQTLKSCNREPQKPCLTTMREGGHCRQGWSPNR